MWHSLCWSISHISYFCFAVKRFNLLILSSESSTILYWTLIWGLKELKYWREILSYFQGLNHCDLLASLEQLYFLETRSECFVALDTPVQCGIFLPR